MEGVLESLTWPSAPTWWAFSLFAAASVVRQALPHVRRAVHRWRLALRLQRNSYIERIELREYETAIGDELAPLEHLQVAQVALVSGALAALPFWLAEGHFEQWWLYAALVFGGLGFLFNIWRLINDPQPDPDTGEVNPLAIKVAMGGFVAAVAIFLLFGVFVITVF